MKMMMKNEDDDLTASSEGEITNVIPIDENPEHNIRITWLCTIERTNVVDSGGNKKANVDVIRGENEVCGRNPRRNHHRILQNQHH